MMWRVLLICVGLAACSSSSETDSPLMMTVNSLRGFEPEFAPRFVTLTQGEAPTLQVGFVDQGTNANLLLERTNGDFAYWLSADGGHIVLQSGMLHSTRGLGEGLLASDLSEPLAMVRFLRGGWSDRLHTNLDGNDRAVTRTYRCLIENEGQKQIQLGSGLVSTVLMTESCRSLDREFINFYWVVASSGQIVQSRQWAGPVIGPVSTRVVSR